MNSAPALDRIRVVLTRPSHPGNIGAAARAMKTMGLSRLVLVCPQHFPDPVATARASGADDVLADVRVVDDLVAALDGVICAAALTARRRELALPMKTARDAAPDLVARAGQGDIALVFGNETSGLSNEELAHCQMPVWIPANPGYSSLNLGAAVQVMCYEVRMAALHPVAPAPVNGTPASVDEIEGLFGHLERAATDSGFLNPERPGRLMARLRRLFGRTGLEREEINILRGILAALETKTK